MRLIDRGVPQICHILWIFSVLWIYRHILCVTLAEYLGQKILHFFLSRSLCTIILIPGNSGPIHGSIQEHKPALKPQNTVSQWVTSCSPVPTHQSFLRKLQSVLWEIPSQQLKHLQLVQNTAARTVACTRKRENITPFLKALHWLPVRVNWSQNHVLMGTVLEYLQELFPSMLLRGHFTHHHNHTCGFQVLVKTHPKQFGF